MAKISADEYFLCVGYLKNKICLKTQLVYPSVLMSLHDISVLYMTEVNKLIAHHISTKYDNFTQYT